MLADVFLVILGMKHALVAFWKAFKNECLKEDFEFCFKPRLTKNEWLNKEHLFDSQWVSFFLRPPTIVVVQNTAQRLDNKISTTHYLTL